MLIIDFIRFNFGTDSEFNWVCPKNHDSSSANLGKSCLSGIDPKSDIKTGSASRLWSTTNRLTHKTARSDALAEWQNLLACADNG